jgi:beta-1,4-mannooligosaccharide/beta-1,4-mannosyl-N-acetylglucosamine phosphorylase
MDYTKGKSLVKRYPGNPILTPDMVPYPSLLTFNAGVTKYNGKYVMIFRNDFGSSEEKRIDGTNLGLALSDDGVAWHVEPDPCFELSDEEILSVNDPRLTVIDGVCQMTFAIIGRHGIRGGIAITDDFNSFRLLHQTLPDNRNIVLFPEKINGSFVRLDRPFASYLREDIYSFDIWISQSPDLVSWGNHQLLLKAGDVTFCNEKIGAGPPPLKTEKGWLQIFHAVDVDPNRGKNGWEKQWCKRYTAGIMLLDLDDPGKILGIARDPLMIPEAEYEIRGGFRNNVIFPGGIILEDSGEVKIYYGAADTVECLASAQVDDLIRQCIEK